MRFLSCIHLIPLLIVTLSNCNSQKFNQTVSTETVILEFDYLSNSKDSIYTGADTITLKIESNISTGYSWKFLQDELQNEEILYNGYIDIQKEIDGNFVPGYDCFLVPAQKSKSITLYYVQPWDIIKEKSLKKNIVIIKQNSF